MRHGWECSGTLGRGANRSSRTDWVDHYASRNGLWPGDLAKVANVNEDVSDVIAYPRGMCSYSQVVVRKVYCGLPAFMRDRVHAANCRVAHKVDEDQGGIDFVQLPQKVQMRQPVSVLIEAL